MYWSLKENHCSLELIKILIWLHLGLCVHRLMNNIIVTIVRFHWFQCELIHGCHFVQAQLIVNVYAVFPHLVKQFEFESLHYSYVNNVYCDFKVLMWYTSTKKPHLLDCVYDLNKELYCPVSRFVWQFDVELYLVLKLIETFWWMMHFLLSLLR